MKQEEIIDLLKENLRVEVNNTETIEDGYRYITTTCELYFNDESFNSSSTCTGYKI